MLLLKMLSAVAVSGWIITTTGQRLWRSEFSKSWRIWFALSSSVGVFIGILFLNVHYLVTPTSQAFGFPFVIAGGDFIDGRWLNGGVGHFLLLAFLSDIALGIALGLVPLSFVSVIYQRRRKHTTPAL